MNADKKKDKTSIKPLKGESKNEDKPQDVEDELEENINPEEVIQIISTQWKKETERLKNLDLLQ